MATGQIQFGESSGSTSGNTSSGQTIEVKPIIISNIYKKVTRIDRTWIPAKGQTIYGLDNSGVIISHKVGNGINNYSVLQELRSSFSSSFIGSVDDGVTGAASPEILNAAYPNALIGQQVIGNLRTVTINIYTKTSLGWIYILQRLTIAKG